ncbi:MAG: thioredoxin family protein [Candidatus Zixiibacteriota bacterium]
MSPKRKIEVFTAGCPICDDAVTQIQAAACPDCEVTVYDLREGCSTMECRDKAKKYGIKAVPAVVIDGKLAKCCAGQGINIDSLRAAGLGQALE